MEGLPSDRSVGTPAIMTQDRNATGEWKPVMRVTRVTRSTVTTRRHLGVDHVRYFDGYQDQHCLEGSSGPIVGTIVRSDLQSWELIDGIEYEELIELTI